ncbi:MAG TPA: hypothetical protein VGR51_08675, partial [Thermoplasmata archaeon]|nr:hypothetical protein [Thermoplasmata archaeon]
MPTCSACDASLSNGTRACSACGTLATTSLDAGKGTQGQATRTTESARKEFGLLRATGVEAPTAERLIDKAGAEIRGGSHARAFAYAQAARRALAIAKTRARLQSELARNEESVRLAKQDGTDTAAAEKALHEASAALAEGRLKAVPTWLKKASVRTQEETKVKSAESILVGAEKAIRYAKERGADVTAAEQELTLARDALRAKAWDKAREAAAKAREAAERSRKVSRYEKFVAGAERAVEVARKSGANLAEARHLITEARHALKDGLFADVQSRSGAAKEAVAEAKRFRTAEVFLERAQKAAKKEERRGIDMSGPGLVLGEAHQALEAREYRKVRELAKDAREAVKDAIIARRLQITLNNLTVDVQELRTIGADPTEAQSLLAEAAAALEAQDFDKGQRLFQRSRRAADDAREARRQEILIDTVQKIVAAAAASGHADAATVRDLIQDVEAMLAGGEAVDVDALIKARLTVVDAQRLKEATQRLGDVRMMLLELKRADIDIAGADDTIALAGEALDEGKFEDAEKQLGELEEVAKTLIETLRDSTVDTLKAAQSAIEKARKAGVPIPDAVRMLGSAQAAMDAGNIYEALEFARIAQARAESTWKKHFEEEAKRDVEAMKAIAERVRRSRERVDVLHSHLEYLTGIGVDVAPARDSLASAQKLLSEKRVDEVEAHLSATEKIVESMRGALRQNAEEALVRIRKAVAEARAQGLMNAEMEAVFLRAEQAVREDRVREGLDSIKALEEAIEHAKEERTAEVHRKDLDRAKKASDRFVRVKRMIDELKKANIDIQGSEDALLSAEKALQSRGFEQVDVLLGDLE